VPVHPCPTCGQPTPPGEFCVRCGAPASRALRKPHHRKQFAAAPAQRPLAPWLFSTLFPHLPRHSERHFHVALVTGGVLVAALALGRLFGVALVCAALLMPVLTLLYLYDVNVYGEEPRWTVASTVAWGVVCGIGVGLLVNALLPSGSQAIDKGAGRYLLFGGVLAPAVAIVLILAAPLLLLRRRRFDEVLDGVTFAGASAASFAAAQAVVVGADVVGGALRPPGPAAPWIERLLALGVATPVLLMSTAGVIGAALWLRRRRSAAERRSLGPLGRPVVALAAALALLVAGAVGETFMAAGTWLAWLAALDVVALIALRRTIHLALLQASRELEIGPPLRCANCGHSTPAHTFCAHCGIALRALPKPPAGPPGAFGGRLHAERAGRGSGHRRLLGAAVLLAALLAAAFAAAAVAQAPGRHARCRRAVACGKPPVLASTSATFAGYAAWRSPAFGYTVRWGRDDWSITAESATGLALAGSDGVSSLTVEGATAPPAQLISAGVAALRGELLGLTPDANAADQLLGPNVGLVPGDGAVYSGATITPQAPHAPVAVAIVSAARGGVTITARVVTPAGGAGDQIDVLQRADDVIDSIEWGR
jgi:ribosomal protein L32